MIEQTSINFKFPLRCEILPSLGMPAFGADGGGNCFIRFISNSATCREQLEDQLGLDLEMIDFPQNLLYNVGRPEVVLAGL